MSHSACASVALINDGPYFRGGQHMHHQFMGALLHKIKNSFLCWQTASSAKVMYLFYF
jgi:hypothetical protein